MLAGGQVASKKNKRREKKKGVSSNGSSENCYLASQIAVELFLPPGFHCQVLQGGKKKKLKASSKISSVNLELIHLRCVKYRKMTVNHRG